MSDDFLLNLLQENDSDGINDELIAFYLTRQSAFKPQPFHALRLIHPQMTAEARAQLVSYLIDVFHHQQHQPIERFNFFSYLGGHTLWIACLYPAFGHTLNGYLLVAVWEAVGPFHRPPNNGSGMYGHCSQARRNHASYPQRVRRVVLGSSHPSLQRQRRQKRQEWLKRQYKHKPHPKVQQEKTIIHHR